MKKYLIKRVIHRLDGISQITCVDSGNDRIASLRFRTDAFDFPLLAGRMYMLRTAARSHGVNLVAALECGLDISAWATLIEQNFFLTDIELKPTAKRLLTSMDAAQRERLLSSLVQNDLKPWQGVLPEPQCTLLGVAFQEAQQRYQHVKRLMAWGLPQTRAEACYDTFGSDACALPLARLKALLSFGSSQLIQSALSSQTSLEASQRVALELLTWLRDQGSKGRTIFHKRELPKSSGKALELCTDQGWTIVDGEYCQLKSHAMLQVAVRRQLERLSSSFFPTYTPQEVQYGYSRYSQVIASYDHQNYQDEIIVAINSRLSVIIARALPSVCEFTSQLSGTLQILYAPAPQLVVYSSSMLPIYNACTENIAVPFHGLPPDLAEYGTVIITDCHLLTLSDFLVALKGVPASTRVVLFDARPAMAEQTAHFLDALKAYYPIIALHAANHAASAIPAPNLEPSGEDLVFNVHWAEQWHQASRGEVFVSDSPSLIATINQRLSRVRAPVVLQTQETSFRKHDRIRVRPAHANKWDPFICRIHSVSGKGLFVEAEGRYSNLSPELVDEAKVSLGFAMSPEAAVQAGARSVVLIAAKASRHAWIDYLKAYRIEVKQVYVHDHPMTAKTMPISNQRLTPLVE